MEGAPANAGLGFSGVRIIFISPSIAVSKRIDWYPERSHNESDAIDRMIGSSDRQLGRGWDRYCAV